MQIIRRFIESNHRIKCLFGCRIQIHRLIYIAMIVLPGGTCIDKILYAMLCHAIEELRAKCDIGSNQCIDFLRRMYRRIVRGEMKDNIRRSGAYNLRQRHFICIIKRNLVPHCRRQKITPRRGAHNRRNMPPRCMQALRRISSDKSRGARNQSSILHGSPPQKSCRHCRS